MGCIFQHNWFCCRQKPETLTALCHHCTIRKYAQGQTLGETYFTNAMALSLDGLIAKMEILPDEQKMAASGLSRCGSLYSIDALIPSPSKFDNVSRTNICITECTLAFWDPDFVRSLFQHDIHFVRTCYENSYIFCLKEKTLMMRDIGRGDVYSAVRYIVNYCHEAGIKQLTHEQIALLCGRSRPSVTLAMHQLLHNEPEIFCSAQIEESSAKTI